MWDKTKNIEAVVKAVQAIFMMYPRDMAQWLFTKMINERGFRLIDAQYIVQEISPPLSIVPEKRQEVKKEEDGPLDMFSELLTSAVQAEGGTVERLHYDWEAENRKTLLEGGCEVELLTTFEKNDSRYQIILGVPVIPPTEDGSQLFLTVMNKSSWHLLLIQKMIHEQINEQGMDERDVIAPLFLYRPLFLWHGTGLKDPNEFCISYPNLDDDESFFGILLKMSREENFFEKRRLRNRDRLESAQEADRKRREAARRRQQLMGDALITEEELDELCPEIDIDQDNYSLLHRWESQRIWEKTVDELLEELPVGGYGLAFFGYSPERESCQEILSRCAWKIRGRASAMGWSSENTSRALIPLMKMASVWLSEEEISDVLQPLRLLDPELFKT